MIPVAQTIFGEPDGNCLQAAIASVLELPLDEVPNFSLARGYWWDECVRFCHRYGVEPVAFNPDWAVQGYHLIHGKSPRGDFHHVVVGKGGIMVHDPHPSGGGLAGVDNYIFFVALMKGQEANDVP